MKGKFPLEAKIKKLPKRILFTPISGYGHIFPCLAAAEALREIGFEVCFLTSPSAETNVEIISDNGFQLIKAPFEPAQLKLPRDIKDDPKLRENFSADYFRDSIVFEKEMIKQFKPSFIWTDMRYSIKASSSLVSNEIIFLSTHRLRFRQDYKFPPGFETNLREYNSVLDNFSLPPIKRLVDLVFGDINIYPFPSQIILGRGPIPDDELYLNIGHLVPKNNIVNYQGEKKGIFITAGTFFRHGQLTTILDQLISALTQTGERLYLAIDNDTASKLVNLSKVSLVGFSDYGKILSQCKLIVHHAGHGTTETALLYGVPQLIYPTDGKGRRNAAVQVEKMGIGKILKTADLDSTSKILELANYLLTSAVSDKCHQVFQLAHSLGGPDYAARIINLISEGINVIPEILDHQTRVLRFYEKD